MGPSAGQGGGASPCRADLGGRHEEIRLEVGAVKSRAAYASSDHDSVPSAFLGLIKSLVRVFENGNHRVIRLEHGDAQNWR